MSTAAAVVGSGPNGLAAAVTLAAAGLDVTVYEATSRWGGGVRTSELGTRSLLHDECSGFHPFAVRNEFATFAGLERYGLEWAWADVEFSHPLDQGGASARRSVAATARSLGRDERAWLGLFAPLVERFDEIADDFLRPVVRVPRRPLALARFAARAVPPVSALLRCFRTDEARALFAGVAAHAFRPFGSPLSSAIGIAMNSAAHARGWPVAVGGSQRIAAAMIAALHELGGRVETSRPIRAVDELGSPMITMLDLAPAAAADVAGARMEARVSRALRRYRHGPGAFKVDFAVERGVPWRHEESRRAGTVHVGGDAHEVAAGEAAIQRGALPERPFVLVGQQYVADPSRSSGDLHPVYAYAHVPAAYAGDATDLIERNIERFAPGFRDRIIERHVRSTTELSVHNPNYVGGDITTGANTPRQLVFRPRIAMDPYRLAEGLYLCSAATPPGAGAHGMCGYLAARSALRALGARLPRRLRDDGSTGVT